MGPDIQAFAVLLPLKAKYHRVETHKMTFPRHSVPGDGRPVSRVLVASVPSGVPARRHDLEQETRLPCRTVRLSLGHLDWLEWRQVASGHPQASSWLPRDGEPVDGRSH